MANEESEKIIDENDYIRNESFLFCIKQAGLSLNELEYMDIGAIVDYFENYVEEMQNANNPKPSTRKATQADFDNF